MAGKLGSRYHSTAGSSHGSKFSVAYQILEVLSFCAPDRGGRGGTPLYKLHGYVPPHRVGFLHRFLSENRYTLCPFWSGIGYGFEGTTGVYERIYRFNSK